MSSRHKEKPSRRRGFRLVRTPLLAMLAALAVMMSFTVTTGVANATGDGERSISAKALDSHPCNSSELHFVMTQIDTELHAPASIHVTWANGAEADVPLEKFTGGTAHYTSYDNLDSTVTSATATIYDGWSGEFNLSHGPCGETPPYVCPEGTDWVDRDKDGKVDRGECETPTEPDYYLETSHKEVCGSITITLRNVSPWIYPVSYSTDGSTPDANGPNYGPVVDNRGDAPDDQTRSKTLTFPEDSGVVTVKYVVAAGTESDLYKGKSVGEVTTVLVETDCKSNDKEVTPTAPTHVDKCGTANDTYTIPSKEGVVYKVNGTKTDAGTYAGSGTVKVTAHAEDGYKLKGQTEWTFKFTDKPCDDGPPPPHDECPALPGNQPEGTDCTPEPPVVINPSGSVTVDCEGNGTAIFDNEDSNTAFGFELVKNGEATLYSVPGDRTMTVNFTGAKPGSTVIVQDGEANLLDSAMVPEECEGEEPPPPPHDECPDMPGNQPEGTDCTPPTPPHDECPKMDGNQPEGTDCTPAEPTDECPDMKGNQPEGTDCTPVTPPTQLPDTGYASVSSGQASSSSVWRMTGAGMMGASTLIAVLLWRRRLGGAL